MRLRNKLNVLERLAFIYASHVAFVNSQGFHYSKSRLPAVYRRNLPLTAGLWCLTFTQTLIVTPLTLTNTGAYTKSYWNPCDRTLSWNCPPNFAKKLFYLMEWLMNWKCSSPKLFVLAICIKKLWPLRELIRNLLSIAYPAVQPKKSSLFLYDNTVFFRTRLNIIIDQHLGLRFPCNKLTLG